MGVRRHPVAESQKVSKIRKLLIDDLPPLVAKNASYFQMILGKNLQGPKMKNGHTRKKKIT